MRLAWLLALSSCGGGHGDRGPVSVTLYDIFGRSPLTGASVVFTDASGTQVVTADASGTATAQVEGSATVTGILDNGARARAVVWYGVNPDDSLVYQNHPLDYTSLAPFTVSFTPIAGASQYEFSSPCSLEVASASPAQLPVTQHCVEGSGELTMEALQNGQVVYSYLPTVSFVGGGSATMPAQVTPELEFTASYPNIPSGIALINFSRHSARAFHDQTFQVSGGSGQVTVSGPVGLSAGIVTTYYQAGLDGPQQVIASQADAATTTFQLDVTHDLLVWIESPTFDVASRTLHVPTSSSGTSGDAPDLFVADVAYLKANGDLEWILVAPEPEDLVLPEIPTGVLDTTIAGDVGVGAVMTVERDDVDGYGMAKRDATDVWQRSIGPPTNRFRLSSPNSRH